MDIIEKTKKDGAIRALNERVNSLKWTLTNNNWENISNKGVFNRLGDAIKDAEDILLNMRVTLEALQELEPNAR